ncbi:MAG: energy transducer TonB [Gammaproteobacteria bacterium]|nr:energy transducer TonB [Gammaproteobacteria bacterium]
MKLHKITLPACAFLVAYAGLMVAPMKAIAQGVANGMVIATPPFSLTDEVLKSNTKGLDVEALITSALSKSPPTKSEYETNSDFEERLRKFSETAFSGKVGPNKKVAVIHPVSALPALWRGGNATAEVRYNAETEVMSVELDSWLLCGLPLKRNISPKRKYTAANGFGNKVEVIQADETETCLDLDDGGETKINDLVLSFKVPKKDAASVKKSLGVVIIGRLAPPFAKSERQHERPTMESPVEINKLVRSLVIKPDDVWLINSATGTVLAKHKTPFLNSEPILAEARKCNHPRYHKSELPNFNLMVELEFSIDASGAISSGSVKKSTGIVDLDDRALKAISKCKFKPGMRDGNPVDGVAIVKFHFSDYYAGY